VINETNIYLNDEERQLLKLGPKYIFDDPRTASRRRPFELAVLKRKIERLFFVKKICPGRPLEQFIAELDLTLQKLHHVSTTATTLHRHCHSMSIQQQRKNQNYHRLVKRLKYKLRSKNIVLQKTDKSKVFHLGKMVDYRQKSIDYMRSTQAYLCLG
jgi:ABC-type microcin C transport system permease subunit YejB